MGLIQFTVDHTAQPSESLSMKREAAVGGERGGDGGMCVASCSLRNSARRSTRCPLFLSSLERPSDDNTVYIYFKFNNILRRRGELHRLKIISMNHRVASCE